MLLLTDGITTSNPNVVLGLARLRYWIGYALPSVIFADALIGLLLVASAFGLTVWILSDCRRLGFTVIRLGFMIVLLVAVAFWTYSIWQISNAEFGGTYRSIGAWLLNALASLGIAGKHE